MPLNKLALSASIKVLLEQLVSSADPQAARGKFADDLSSAIEIFVKTGSVVTTGSATTQTGTIT